MKKTVKNVIPALIMLLGFAWQGLDAESQGAVVGTDGGLKTDAEVKFQTTSDTRFDLSASPDTGNGWHFVESYTSSNWTKNSYSSGGASAYITDCNPRNSTELFPGVISGKMGKDGPEPGNLVNWSVTGKADFYFIEAESTGSNIALIVDLSSETVESILSFSRGDSSTKSSVNSNWTLSPGSEASVENKNKVTISGRGEADWKPEAGVYNVVGKRSSDQTKTDAIVLKAVEIEIEGPVSPDEGEDSEEFEAKVNPSVLKEDATYEWKWRTDASNPGNNPSVDFEDDDEEKTIINEAHWFASPNSRLQSVTTWSCTYLISCEVMVEGKKCKKEVAWRVEIPLLTDCGAPACVDNPRITGIPAISSREVDGHTEWYVSGKGTLAKVPASKRTALSSNSQFWNKMYVVHEGRHLSQWETWDQLKNLYDADTLYTNILQSMTSTESQADLESKIMDAIVAVQSRDTEIAYSFETEMEMDAFNVSNAVEPNYLEFDL